jgi:hypothetical protein
MDWVFSDDDSKHGYSDPDAEEPFRGSRDDNLSRIGEQHTGDTADSAIDKGLLDAAVQRAAGSLTIIPTGDFDAIVSRDNKADGGHVKDRGESSGPKGHEFAHTLNYHVVERLRDSDDAPPGLRIIGPGHWRMPLRCALRAHVGINNTYYTGFNFIIPAGTVLAIKTAHAYCSDGIKVRSRYVGCDHVDRELVISFSAKHSVLYRGGYELFDLYLISLASSNAMYHMK